MEQRAWVATRKGLFELRQRAGAWGVERISFLGEECGRQKSANLPLRFELKREAPVFVHATADVMRFVLARA